MKNILITGGTGLIGQKLTNILLENGYNVAFLSRKAGDKNAIKTYLWDVEKGQIDLKAIQEADAIIHLAGENVGEKRWTSQRKNQIIESRTKTTALLVKTLQETPNEVKAFISASAVGIYGSNTNNTQFDENSAFGNDFLAQVTQKWENSVDEIQKLGIRTVKIRIGIVLSNEGGALPQLILPIKYGFGAVLGTGKQYLSWIHEKDVCRIFQYALENENLVGAFNAIAPNPITNKDLTHLLAKQLHRFILFPHIPSFLLDLVLGEMALIVTKGNFVSNHKIVQSGFKFSFDKIENALDDLLK